VTVPPAAELEDARDIGLGVGAFQAGQVARLIFRPVDVTVEEGAQERLHGTELAQPVIDAILPDPARP
jgi:hypothetical protein